MIKSKVLFPCTGNSCRTQMAEAFLRDLAADLFDIVSAGGDPTPLDEEAIEARGEVGIDISGQTTDHSAGVRRVRDQLRHHIVQFVGEHQ